MINKEALPGLSTIRSYKQSQLPLWNTSYIVYFLFDKNKLVYVGSTIRILQRISQHYRDKEFTHVSILMSNIREYNQIESYYINRYKPKYNGLPHYKPAKLEYMDITNAFTTKPGAMDTVTVFNRFKLVYDYRAFNKANSTKE